MLRNFSNLKGSKLWYIGLPASLVLVAIIASYSILGSNTVGTAQHPVGLLQLHDAVHNPV